MKRVKLDVLIAGSWSTYGGSMFSVLKNCGMLDANQSFHEFMGMTGIAFQFITSKSCAASSVTVYDWESQHPIFLKRIGVSSDFCFSMPHHSEFENVCKIAEQEIKQSLDSDRGVVLWGVDTGEFGIINGYDDFDQVFYVSGIGSKDSAQSNPILYANLGRTFQPAPIMYCHYPTGVEQRDNVSVWTDSLKYYLEHMTANVSDGDYANGLAAYDNWILSLDNHYDSYGLRYIAGVYAERKTIANNYLKTIDLAAINVSSLADVFHQLESNFSKVHKDILEQQFDGWNHLHKPVTDAQAKAIKDVLLESKMLEEQAIKIAENILPA